VGGQHRSGQRRRRWPLLAVAAALVLGTGVVIGVRALTGCRAVDVLVAADAAVAGPVRDALQGERRGPGACSHYQVVDAPSTLVGDIRAGAPGLPAVWIPDSSLALGTLDTTSGALVDQGPSLASSPVVLVVPEADGERYGDPTGPVSWDTMLAHPQPPALPDPGADRAGLAAITALRTAMGDEGERPRPSFVAAVLALSQGSLPSQSAGYAGVDRDGAAARAFLATEQSAVRHNLDRAVPAVDTVALREAAAALDFPFVRIRTGQPGGLDDAVNDLEAQLTGPVGRAAFGAAGLRAPDGARVPGPDAPGWLGPQAPPAAPPPRPMAVETLRMWSALTLQSRLLAVIDVSGSMAAAAGGSNRITLAADAARSGLALFPDTASVGLWAFSARPPPATSWQELVSLGLLTEPVGAAPSRRVALAEQAGTLRDRVGGETALYDTALAATRAVRTGYQEGSSNLVVLITDGRNEVAGGIDLATVLQTLRAEADPTRPVPVIAIGLGPEADVEALRQIAQATGGRSYQAQDPQDIRDVLLDAISQRACRPGC
jgi:Ca-activated chloride channel family protein